MQRYPSLEICNDAEWSASLLDSIKLYMDKFLSFVNVPQDGVNVDIASFRAKLFRGRAQVNRNVGAVKIVGHGQLVVTVDGNLA